MLPFGRDSTSFLGEEFNQENNAGKDKVSKVAIIISFLTQQVE